MVNLCSCSYQMVVTKDNRDQGGEWQGGVAVLKNPGAHDVITILDKDGTPVNGNVWDFLLTPYHGAISIPTE